MYKLVKSLSTSASPVQRKKPSILLYALLACTPALVRVRFATKRLQFPVIESGSSPATSPGAHRRRAKPQSRCELRCAERWRGPRVHRGPFGLTFCLLVVDDTDALRTGEGLNREISFPDKGNQRRDTDPAPRSDCRWATAPRPLRVRQRPFPAPADGLNRNMGKGKSVH